MPAVTILVLILQVLALLFLAIGVGLASLLGNIAGALGHIAGIWTAPAEIRDEERGKH